MRRVPRSAAAALVVLAFGALAANASGPRAVRAVLVVEGWQPGRVTITTLSGRRGPAPGRVRTFPTGLSPDARHVAGVSGLRQSGNAVLLGPVRGGQMKTVLVGTCDRNACPRGADPTFAWAPDGQRLAAAANPQDGATILRVFDLRGHLVRSFQLPAENPERGGRAFHRIVSWSPDGRRLLLTRADQYVDTALVALDVRTGQLWRAAAIFSPKDSPRTSWSPNGRLLALWSEGFDPRSYAFAVIDVPARRAIVECRSDGRPCALGPATSGPWMWSIDSKTLFVGVGRYVSGDRTLGGIDRVELNGRRSHVVPLRAGWAYPIAALATGLLYERSIETAQSELQSDRLLRLDAASGRTTTILSSREGFSWLIPLSRLP